MRTLVVAAVLAVFVVLAVGAGVVAQQQQQQQQASPANQSVSGTTHETLCIEGYLPDGTYFNCP